jgi:hypothetical protein
MSWLRDYWRTAATLALLSLAVIAAVMAGPSLYVTVALAATAAVWAWLADVWRNRCKDDDRS